jgi:hypothetical protein
MLVDRRAVLRGATRAAAANAWFLATLLLRRLIGLALAGGRGRAARHGRKARGRWQ